MKAVRCGAWVAIVAFAGLVLVQSVMSHAAKRVSDRERLLGAWHLEHIDSPGADGKPSDIPQPTGMLIYTRDGHMSVQLMYPASAGSLSNQYVRNGYEASFGSFTIDERTHTLTHHVQGRLLATRSSVEIFLASTRSPGTVTSSFAQPTPRNTGLSPGSITERLATLVVWWAPRANPRKGVKQCRNANWERAILKSRPWGSAV
jgi:Lipocalin-like domain